MPRRQSGFALLLTLALLALLVLAVVALSALVKVNGEVATSGVYQTQARQNAQLALDCALGELQRHAGDDARVTGMAGLTGIAAGAGNSTRHWCGVWRGDGSFVAWLASGAQTSSTAALQNGVTSLDLVANGSVGAAAANSEHIIAGKIPVTVSETPGAPGAAATVGRYAWLVFDEGVKTPAYAPVPVVAPVIFSTSATNAPGKLRDALAAYAANLPRVISYEQLAVLPTPSAALPPSVLQDNFHHTTLTSRFVAGAQLQSGFINVNTNSAILWRNVLQTYNTAPGAPAQIASANVSSRGTSLQNGLAAFSTAGKAANGPFTTVAAFGDFLATIFPASGTPAAGDIMTTIGGMLTVRSDTFRIRAYGEALNPADSTKTEAVAFCEAIVQRTLDPAPNALGRKFTVIHFRWLGPDDV